MKTKLQTILACSQNLQINHTVQSQKKKDCMYESKKIENLILKKQQQKQQKNIHKMMMIENCMRCVLFFI